MTSTAEDASVEYSKRGARRKQHCRGGIAIIGGAMAKPAEILLLSDMPQRVHAWARILTGAKARLWQGIGALTPETAIDVIVTDRNLTCDMLPDSRSCSRLACGEIGVVYIRDEGSADVRLPSDFTPRELQLACFLLTDVVRLRRQCNRERRMHRVLTELAMSDPLTGLPNRRAWEDRMANTTIEQTSDSHGLCVAVLDLDHFKSINERFGHLAGDELLRQVAGRLADEAEQGLFAARLGGDEFGLLLPGTDASSVAIRVERLRTGCCADVVPSVSASAGLAFGGPDEFTRAEELFGAADQALRQAKSGGRDRTVAADSLTCPSR